MSQRRGFINGAYGWIEEEPSHARVAGFGGRMVTPIAAQVAPIVRTPAERASATRRTEAAREERMRLRIAAELRGDKPPKQRCGALMRVSKLACARYYGHKDCHRSRQDMNNALAMRTGRGLL